MALRIRKDIKKSSYYVWFLGAKESKGIRGKEYILPIIDHLIQREKEIEPFKVTLQISHKGLKIIQNVLTTNPKTAKPKNEVIKHFIPHNTITCVYQSEDIVSCILLLFNPVTKCPLHAHVYRCDSTETATLLKNQLEILIERPENQKKYSDLENRFAKPVEVKKKFDSSIGSDTGTSTRESESSEERYPPAPITSLYDSLAAELRQKLRKDSSPILLPPRDYDTVHRQRGNLQNIDNRRCLTASVVGQPGNPGSERPGGLERIGERPERPPDRSGERSSERSAERIERPVEIIDRPVDRIERPVERIDRPVERIDRPVDRIERPIDRIDRVERSTDRIDRIERPGDRIDRLERHGGDKFDKIEKMDKHDRFAERHMDKHLDKHGDRFERLERHGERIERTGGSRRLERRMESSGGSSGIGSDHAPSPESEGGNYLMDNQSTSDEEWNIDQTESTLYLMHGDMILPRASRHSESSKFSPEPPNSPNSYPERDRERFQRYPDEKYLDKSSKDKYPEKYPETSLQRYRYDSENNREKTDYLDKYQRHAEEIQKYSGRYDPNFSKYDEPNGRYVDNGLNKHRSNYENYEEDIELKNSKYIHEENHKFNNKYYPEDVKNSRYKEERYYDEKIKPKYIKDERYYQEFDDYQQKAQHFYSNHEKSLDKNKKYPSKTQNYQPTYQQDYFDDTIEYRKHSEDSIDSRKRPESLDSRKRPESRQRSPTPPENVSPKDRFKDAKEKFLLLERERISEENRIRREEMCQSVPNLKDKAFLKRHESMSYPKGAFDDERERRMQERYQPKPAPRTILEEECYRREPLDRYRSPDRSNNRRSLYNQIEHEHKAKSNEIAKELKRRSYLENPTYEKEFYLDDFRTSDMNRYPDKDFQKNFQYSKSNVELDKLEKLPSEKFAKTKKTPAGYRHSYAEPNKIGKKMYPEMVHRTNSSVSNSGRVGLASVNPY